MEISCTVRRMIPEEVNIAVTWAEREGWNPGIHDGACFYRIDPSGFFIAEVGGMPAATAVVANYSPEFAFGGFFIVHPDYRGKGVGTCISRYALAHAGDRNFGIDGVLAMQSKYAERDGFIFAYRNKRYEGVGGGTTPEGLVQGWRSLLMSSMPSTGSTSLLHVQTSSGNGFHRPTAGHSQLSIKMEASPGSGPSGPVFQDTK